MRGPVGVGVCVILGGLLLAGCVGDSGTASKPSSTPTAVPPTVDTATGSISGTTVNDELVPVADVEVGLSQLPERVTRSDAEGQFTFNGLEAGSYTLIAQKLRYETVQLQVAVVPGEVVTAQLVLAELSVPVPRTASFVGAAFIEFGWKVPAVGGSVTAPNVSKADRTDFYYRMDADPVTAVSSMHWQPNLPGTAKRLFLAHWLSKGACDEVCDFLGQVTGLSPLIQRTDSLVELVSKEGFEINGYVGLASCLEANTNDPTRGSGNCTSAPDSIVEVAIQQKMTIYTTVFYVTPAPPGYDPSPPK